MDNSGLILSDFWHSTFHTHSLLRDAGAAYASGGSTPGSGVHRTLQIVASRPRKTKFSRSLLQIVAGHINLAQCGQLIRRKINKFDATRFQILKLKCTKFDFRWGCAPEPAVRAYSALPTPSSI